MLSEGDLLVKDLASAAMIAAYVAISNVEEFAQDCKVPVISNKAVLASPSLYSGQLNKFDAAVSKIVDRLLPSLPLLSPSEACRESYTNVRQGTQYL